MGLYIHVLLAEANNHCGAIPEMGIRQLFYAILILISGSFSDCQLQLFFSLNHWISLALLRGLAAVSRLPLDLAAPLESVLGSQHDIKVVNMFPHLPSMNKHILAIPHGMSLYLISVLPNSSIP